MWENRRQNARGGQILDSDKRIHDQSAALFLVYLLVPWSTSFFSLIYSIWNFFNTCWAKWQLTRLTCFKFAHACGNVWQIYNPPPLWGPGLISVSEDSQLCDNYIFLAGISNNFTVAKLLSHNCELNEIEVRVCCMYCSRWTSNDFKQG